MQFDVLFGLFVPIINFVKDFLNIQVAFGGLTVPLWGFFGFAILVGIFVRMIGVIAGIGFDH